MVVTSTCRIMDSYGKIVLNVGGEIYETRYQTLKRFPNTLLGNQNKLMLHYCEKSQQYFFDRSRVFFDAILFFYQSNGLLSCPPGVPLDLFQEECHYFQLPTESIRKTKSQEQQELDDMEAIDTLKEIDGARTLGKFRAKIWDVIENPETSTAAKFFSLFSLLMIAIAVAATCLESVPSLRSKDKVFENNPWGLNELVLNSWFLLELLLATFSTPNVRQFLSKTMTWVDFIAVVPYFIVLSISKDNLQSLGLLRIIRLARITRMFRLSRHSQRLKLVGQILLSCMADFRTLLLCVAMIVMLAGSLMYFIEGEGSGFQSIPQGMYWAAVTLTTVGYGDIYPFSYWGKLFAGAYMLFGAATISMPLLSVIGKFEENYR